jgi:hypothetical protein
MNRTGRRAISEGDFDWKQSKSLANPIIRAIRARQYEETGSTGCKKGTQLFFGAFANHGGETILCRCLAAPEYAPQESAFMC